jgi:uncharacterized protein YjiS (DUF1127 family)
MAVSINKTAFEFKLPEMASYRSTWADADYEPVLPHHEPGPLARVAASVRRSVAAYLQRRRVMNELAEMSDRDLADLGISRYDIPRVFDPAFALEHAKRRLGA